MAVTSKTQLAIDIAASTFTAPQQVILDNIVDSYEDIFSQLTTVQRNLLTPTQGLMIYNTDTDLYEYWNGVTWLGVGNSLSQLSIKVNLSSADILALNTTAKVLVAAAGAGYGLSPNSLTYRYTRGSASYTGSYDISLMSSTKLVTDFFAQISSVTINGGGNRSGVEYIDSPSGIDALVENDSLVLKSSAAIATGDGTLTVWLNYSIIVW